MKRAAISNGSTNAKRQAVDAPDGKALHVAEHYNARRNSSTKERDSSAIVHLKKLNNWVKAVLIIKYTPPHGAYVLDLACGKGGDLNKWERRQVGLYAGVDIAHESIRDLMQRYNGEGTSHKVMTFPTRLASGDCWGMSLRSAFEDVAPFDVCSCQFALHYSFNSEVRARQAMRNVSEALRPGGYFIGTLPDANVIMQKLRAAPGLEFGNSVVNITFGPESVSKKFPSIRPFGIEYAFCLKDAVDCPEWLVPFPILQKLASEYGLELELKQNFHEFINKESGPHAETMNRVLGPRGLADISADEWEAAYLYLVFVFKKVGGVETRRRPVRPAGGLIQERDIIRLK